jgi:hypothetical protein
MDFENICRIIDTVTKLSVHDKLALLRDLAHQALPTPVDPSSSRFSSAPYETDGHG